MTRILLALIVGLASLLAASRLTQATETEPTSTAKPMARAMATRLVARPPVPPPGPGSEVAAPIRTPLLSQLARLEARRRLEFSGRYTYLDSMLVATDSTIRRWPVPGSALRVAVAPPIGSSSGRLDQIVWNALAAWERPDLGIRFSRTADSLGADIVVGWVDRFESTGVNGAHQTGLTSLLGDGKGELQLARVQLALGDGSERRLTDREIEVVALHEIGHALGLPHSGDRADIMFPTVVATQLSPRDRASLTLLYSLPPGPLREPNDR